eukprot:1339200-Prymnesium_polylepis.1
MHWGGLRDAFRALHPGAVAYTGRNVISVNRRAQQTRHVGTSAEMKARRITDVQTHLLDVASHPKGSQNGRPAHKSPSHASRDAHSAPRLAAGQTKLSQSWSKWVSRASAALAA